ncbi:DAZ-associated protein 1-like isoform X2 [Mya arenaria]|uniref:DAZ-associated protein 1-like isoform X2 n=1 Tax=Mya arenaria TaxID=6604 RepID=UPI0022E14761|nr:DAZ-associated protein 1-like isoform X2 [Mya arenaria]
MPGFERNEAGKLFVGGLSWDTSKDSLLQYFSQYGEVVDCIVMKNQETGKSRGFGFVTYGDPSCVEVVLSVPAHIVDGRQVDPKACNPKGQQRGGMGGGGGPNQMPMGDGNNRNNRGPRGGNSRGGGGGDRKVFLGGLPNQADESAIRNFFGKYGKVTDVTVMYDSVKQRSRGFGFLTFETEDAVNAVCREHFINFNGKKVECKRATPRDRNDQDDMPGPHPGIMQQVEMGIHGGPPPHHMGGPDPHWGGQEQQWNQQVHQPQSQSPPGAQFPPPGMQFQQSPYQGDQSPAVPPAWAQQPPPQGAAGWPPGSGPQAVQQAGAPPVSAAFMQASPYTSQQAFQPPPGTQIYQYAASPPGTAQPPPANGQVPPPVQPTATTLGYTSSTYASPAQSAVAGARPGYQDYAAAHVQVGTTLGSVPGTPSSATAASAYYQSPYGAQVPAGSAVAGVPDPYAQTGVAPPPTSIQLAGAPAGGTAYGSPPAAVAPGQVIPGSADPSAAQKQAIDYSAYYSAYGYSVDGAPGGTTAAYGSTPAPAQAPTAAPTQPGYGSPEPAPVAYSGAPGPSPTFQRQGSAQGYHPYARR